MDSVPDEIEDIRYCSLDVTQPDGPDYFFIPLIFLESFYCPAVVLRLGPYEVKVPLDWSVLVCDEDYSDVGVMPLTSLNDRGFHVPAYNPLRSTIPLTYEAIIVNVYADVKWFFPRLRDGHLLAVPLELGDEPLCVFFVKEKSKILDNLDIYGLF